MTLSTFDSEANARLNLHQHSAVIRFTVQLQTGAEFVGSCQNHYAPPALQNRLNSNLVRQCTIQSNGQNWPSTGGQLLQKKT